MKPLDTYFHDNSRLLTDTVWDSPVDESETDFTCLNAEDTDYSDFEEPDIAEKEGF